MFDILKNTVEGALEATINTAKAITIPVVLIDEDDETIDRIGEGLNKIGKPDSD